MTSETPDEPQPLPGDQVPAAVLPGSDYGAQDTSSSLPVAPAAKPRNRPLIVLATLAAAFFLGMGAFMTLWLAEQDDHHTTGQQLEAVRGDLGTARKTVEDATARYSELDSDRKRLQTNLERLSPCVQAAKEFKNALPPRDFKWDSSAAEIQRTLEVLVDTPC